MPLEEPVAGLQVAWIQYQLRKDPVTHESTEQPKAILLADLPLRESSSRLLLIGATSPTLEFVANQYCQDVELDRTKISSLPIDSQLLKRIIQETELHESITGIKSHEWGIGYEYEGTTRINTPKDYDVRNDSKFHKIIDLEWEVLRFLPKVKTFEFKGLPPVVELSVKGSIRMWNEWSDPRMLPFLRDLCERLADLVGKELDEELFLKATSSPYTQASLGDFDI